MSKSKKATKSRGMTRELSLKNISEIRRFFHRNEEPIYFVSATNFNLLGIDEWCKNFKYILLILIAMMADIQMCFAHPSNLMQNFNRSKT